jgi:hypothetical protein
VISYQGYHVSSIILSWQCYHIIMITFSCYNGNIIMLSFQRYHVLHFFTLMWNIYYKKKFKAQSGIKFHEMFHKITVSRDFSSLLFPITLNSLKSNIKDILPISTKSILNYFICCVVWKLFGCQTSFSLSMDWKNM